MRAVIDTNVLVSALLSNRGAPAQVVAAFEADRFTLVVSEPILAEYAEVFGREKFGRHIAPDQATRLMTLLRKTVDLVPITGSLLLCNDPKDSMFIETAVAGVADVVVTGDRHLTDLAETPHHLASAGIRVITVAQFLQELAVGPP